ncbi:hypothetical protein [Lysinibacillus agricola]|uniref:hypothetical protein n=1 Tax=Lysinibacillus agricola TaxID=2590012 RepID=UPI003C1B5DF9
MRKGFSNIILTFNLYHLEQLEKFLYELELLWSERLNEYELQGNEIQDEESRQEFFDFYYDDWSVYRDEYPKIAKFSILVSGHSYFEKICSDYYQKAIIDNSNLKPIDKRNKHAVDYVNWFRKNFGKHLFERKTYQQFLDFNQVRNRIVHSNGKVDKEKGSLLKIIKQSQGLDLNHHNEIEIDSEYVKEILNMISDLITQIHFHIYVEK